MLIAALFTIAKIGKQHKCPSTDEQIKIWACMGVCVCVYYSSIKKKETLPFAAIRMDLESIMLSEIDQRRINTT